MNKHLFRFPDYLEHMLEALDRIQKYTDGKSKEQFLADHLVQDAVMRNFGVLGEAANNCSKVSSTIATQYPQLPLAKIYGLRNLITHAYWTVDLEILWNVIERDIPELRDQIRSVLSSLGGRTPSA